MARDSDDDRTGAAGAPAQGRTVRLYPWYALFFNAYFWMPVFILYFLKHMPLDQVLRLEALYYFGVVLLEVPSGYFSDRVGRRPTLLIACASLTSAYLLFFFGGSFAVFAIAQLALAAGLAFNSGTDTSLHYDALSSLGRESEYDAREAIAARNSLLAGGIAGLTGGAAALVELRYAYALAAAAAAVSFGLVLAMAEPSRHEKTLVPEGPIRQVKICAGLLGDRLLGWTFAYAIVMTVLNHIPYEFYQPYIEHALAGASALAQTTPLAAGLHMGIAMLIASALAARSVRIRNRIGYRPALLLATLLQIVIILGMGLLLHPLMLLLILLRSAPRALAAAPVNAAIAPRVGQRQRATYLSIQSLAGRLAFAGFLVGLSVIPGADPDAKWQAISTKLLISGAAGAIALLGLAIVAARQPSASTAGAAPGGSVPARDHDGPDDRAQRDSAAQPPAH